MTTLTSTYNNQQLLLGKNRKMDQEVKSSQNGDIGLFGKLKSSKYVCGISILAIIALTTLYLLSILTIVPFIASVLAISIIAGVFVYKDLKSSLSSNKVKDPTQKLEFMPTKTMREVLKEQQKIFLEKQQKTFLEEIKSKGLSKESKDNLNELKTCCKDLLVDNDIKKIQDILLNIRIVSSYSLNNTLQLSQNERSINNILKSIRENVQHFQLDTGIFIEIMKTILHVIDQRKKMKPEQLCLLLQYLGDYIQHKINELIKNRLQYRS